MQQRRRSGTRLNRHSVRAGTCKMPWLEPVSFEKHQSWARRVWRRKHQAKPRGVVVGIWAWLPAPSQPASFLSFVFSLHTISAWNYLNISLPCSLSASITAFGPYFHTLLSHPSASPFFNPHSPHFLLSPADAKRRYSSLRLFFSLSLFFFAAA